MLKKDMLKISKNNLMRRKSRTFLTVLGIVIGTVSIVLMMSIGLGMQESFDSILDGMGSVSVIEVTKADDVSTTRSAENKDENIKDIDIAILAQIEGVEVVSPVVETNLRIVSGKYAANINIVGLIPETMVAMGFDIEEGRLLNSFDKYNIVFGANTLKNFKDQDGNSSSGGGFSFGKGGGTQEKPVVVDVFNDRMKGTLDMKYAPQTTGRDSVTEAELYNVKGIGVLKSGDMLRDRKAYMNISALKTIIEEYDFLMENEIENGYDKAYVKVADNKNIEAIISELEGMGYETMSSIDMANTLNSTSDLIQIAFGAIGAVSLLVAAIGITNTMIMAISERKREIGIMKVVGASLRDIKGMFLLEAGMIGFLGGIIGVVLSLIGTMMINYIGSGGGGASSGRMMAASPMSGQFSSVVPYWLIILAIVFSTVIGVVAGYMPANKAMRSSALSAMNNE